MTDQPKPDLQDGDGLRKPLERLLAAFKGMMPFPLVVQAVAAGLVRDAEAALATPQPTPDAAEGAQCIDPNSNHPSIAHRAEMDTAPPKLAPDAVRKEIRRILQSRVRLVSIAEDIEPDIANVDEVTNLIIATLSAPVPSPDGVLINSIRAIGPPDPSDEEFEHGWAACNQAVVELLTDLGFFPSDTEAAEPIAGPINIDPEVLRRDALLDAPRAAEPVAWRWRYRKDPHPKWYFVDSPLSGDTRNLEIEPLYATPPVRGDRETLLWAADVAAKGAKQCHDDDSEWHKGFRYAADNTALGIAADLRRAADALSVQSTARPDKESAAQIIAKRMFGSKPEDLESLTRDNCRDTVTEIFELAGAQSGAGEREAAIEECVKIAEETLVGHTLTPGGLARQDEAEDIAARIRDLSRQPPHSSSDGERR